MKGGGKAGIVNILSLVHSFPCLPLCYNPPSLTSDVPRYWQFGVGGAGRYNIIRAKKRGRVFEWI